MSKIGMFECAVCGYERVHQEEVNQSPECPECGGHTLFLPRAA